MIYEYALDPKVLMKSVSEFNRISSYFGVENGRLIKKINQNDIEKIRYSFQE